MSLPFIIGAVSVTAAAGVNVIRSGEFHPWHYRLLRIGKPKYPISGYVDAQFKEVENVFRRHFDQGREVGASVAVFASGRKVVELYGGYANYEKGEIYSPKTLEMIFSSSKVLESIALARLVDKQLLNYNTTISSIWPEFGKGDKDKVTIEDLMRHEAGVPYISAPKPKLEELLDKDKLESLLANETHHYNAEKVRCYHTFTRGWILNGIVRRVDPKGRSLGQIYEEEFNLLPGVEIHLGLSQEYKLRRTKWYGYPPLDMALMATLPKSIVSPRDFNDVPIQAFRAQSTRKAVSNLYDENEFDFGNKDFLTEFEIPSCNGFTNAASLALLGAYLSHGGSLDGLDFVSRDALEAAVGDEIATFDACLQVDIIMTRAGFGVYILDELDVDTKFYGWSGFGGSAFLFNLEYDFSFSYTMNASHSTSVLSGRAKVLLISAFKSHLASYSS